MLAIPGDAGGQEAARSGRGGMFVERPGDRPVMRQVDRLPVCIGKAGLFRGRDIALMEAPARIEILRAGRLGKGWGGQGDQ